MLLLQTSPLRTNLLVSSDAVAGNHLKIYPKKGRTNVKIIVIQLKFFTFASFDKKPFYSRGVLLILNFFSNGDFLTRKLNSNKNDASISIFNWRKCVNENCKKTLILAKCVTFGIPLKSQALAKRKVSWNSSFAPFLMFLLIFKKLIENESKVEKLIKKRFIFENFLITFILY